MFTEGLLAIIGLLFIAFKLTKDDNEALKEELADLKLKVSLQPLDAALSQADQEVANAKKNYDSATSNDNH